MKKRISQFMLACILFVSCLSAGVSAASDIQVLLDGTEIVFDVPPYLDTEKNRVMVPMRKIFEALDALISWDVNTQTVTAIRGNTVMMVTIGSPTAKVGRETVDLDAPAVLISDRTMVPLRFVSENLGATVEWEDETQTVRITTSGSAGYFSVTDEMQKTAASAAVKLSCENTKAKTSISGFGVVYSADGLVLTSYELVAGADKVTLTLPDGRPFDAPKIVGYDKQLDLAVLQISADGLPCAKAADQPAVGGDSIFSLFADGKVSVGFADHLAAVPGGESVATRMDCVMAVGGSGCGVYDRNGKLLGTVVQSSIETGADGTVYCAYTPISYVQQVLDQDQNLTLADFSAKTAG